MAMGKAQAAAVIGAFPAIVHSGDWLDPTTKPPGSHENGSRTRLIVASNDAAPVLRASVNAAPNAFSAASSAERSVPPAAVKTKTTCGETVTVDAIASLPGEAAGGADAAGSSSISSVTRALATVVRVSPLTVGADDSRSRPPLMRRPL